MRGKNKSVSKLLSLALDNGGDSLETRAGVDGGLGQRRYCAGSVAIELHEDQIPDFDVAAAVAGNLQSAWPSSEAVGPMS